MAALPLRRDPSSTMADLHQLSYAAGLHRQGLHAYDVSLADEQPQPSAVQLPPMRSSPPAAPASEQTFCRWCIVNANLEFLYLGPEFARHGGPLSSALLGRSLVEFVCVEEQQSVYAGLREVSNFTGAVTPNVSFAGVRQLRRMLSHEPAYSTWQATPGGYVDYEPTNIVLNWVAHGVALCFLHTAQTEAASSHAWAACMTPNLTDIDLRSLHNSLVGDKVSKLHFPTDSRTECVFQIFENTPERRPLLTWPLQGRLVPEWTSTDYIHAAADVGMESTNKPADARTNCTHRYQKQKTITTNVWGETELRSALIPHGSIIFAYHRLSPINPTAISDSRSRIAFPTQDRPLCNPSPYAYVSSLGQSYATPDYFQWTCGYWDSDPYSSPPSRAVSDLYPSYTASTASRPQQDAPALVATPVVSPAVAGLLDKPAVRRRRASSGGSHNGGPARSGGHPPYGVTQCAGCGSTSSPEWRRGESGRKDLCNACGLRYSRRKAKAQGAQSQRRKKVALNVDNAALYLAGSRRGSVDSTATTSTQTTSTQVDTPPASSASTPSPPSNILELSHYSYATQQPDHHLYYASAAEAFNPMNSQPYYDPHGRLCEPVPYPVPTLKP